MQCKDLESVLVSEGLGPLSAEVREHLGGCSRCRDFLADLDAIVSVARTLPAEVTPPDRVWISLRAQLEAEGLIKEPAEIAVRSSWWENLGLLWKPRSLATATAAAALALAVTAVYLTHLPGDKNAVNEQEAPKVNVATQPPGPETVTPPPLAPVIAATKNPTRGPATSKVKALAPSPSENASTTLSEAESDISNMRLAGEGNVQVDASLRQNLRTLNEFIAECEQHLRKNPQDELAREYLNIAYQQKADLLAAMMESGRSEH